MVEFGRCDAAEVRQQRHWSSHEMPKLTSANECLNLFPELETILSIVTIITVIPAIFFFLFSSERCL